MKIYLASAAAAFGLAAPAMATATLQTFSSSTQIVIPGTDDMGPADPFPSTIQVNHLIGPMTGLTVTLFDFSHTRLNDVGIGLIGPNGTGIWLFNGTGDSHAISDLNITFSDSGAAKFRFQTVSGTYKPGSVYSGTSLFPANTPRVTKMSGFNGIDPNGSWRLFVRDYADYYVDAPGPGTGQIAGGWALSFYAEAAPAPEPAAWAMMVAGFGLVGGALRKRSRVSVRFA